MGFLKTLGLKKKTGKSAALAQAQHDVDDKAPPSPSSASSTPRGRRHFVPASGPLTPTTYMRPPVIEKEAKSDGETEEMNEEPAAPKQRGEEEDSVPELQKLGKSDSLKQERSLRRGDPLLGSRSRSSGKSDVAEFSRRVLQGGSLRGPPGYTVPQEEPQAPVPAHKAATIADRPSRQHRRNPSLETILRNMYEGDSTKAAPKEKLLAVPENPKVIQPASGSRSGQLAPRDFSQERDTHRISKARSGVLAPRDWGSSDDRTNVREGIRAPRSGQLTPRDFTQEERQSGATLSARSTRLGQVAPRDMLQPDVGTPPKASAGGSGTLQAREWGQESDGIIQSGRSRSGQLAPRDSGGSLGVDRMKQGPRSMSSHKSVRDIFQGERQQKGAAQRRLSRNRVAATTPEEPVQTAIVSSTVRRSARGGRNDAWQEPIAEGDENGSGTLQPMGSGALKSVHAESRTTAKSPPMSPLLSPTGGANKDKPSSARARLQQSESLLSSSRAAGGASRTSSGTPQTASERLAASLAASVASVQAQKRGSRSGSLQPVLGMPIGRSRQDGPSDNVLQRPFANVREKYQLQMEELGRGRFGVIRVCLDRKGGEKLACKSISKARLKTWQDADDVRKEVTVMELLQGHPHVVNLKGAFEDALNVHLVMERCEGGELFDRIMAKKRYSEQEAAIVCRTVVGVLRYCHALGYIHRDLKPENILLCSTDNDTSVKVIDFGVATPFKPGQPCTEEVGTPFYLAPEVLQQSYGPEADIWSAGVVLYILLCGVPPFWAKDNEGIRTAIKEGKLDLASGPWKTISEPAKDLVRQMLTMDPAQRIKGDQILAHPWIANLGRV